MNRTIINHIFDYIPLTIDDKIMTNVYEVITGVRRPDNNKFHTQWSVYETDNLRVSLNTTLFTFPSAVMRGVSHQLDLCFSAKKRQYTSYNMILPAKLLGFFDKIAISRFITKCIKHIFKVQYRNTVFKDFELSSERKELFKLERQDLYEVLTGEEDRCGLDDYINKLDKSLYKPKFRNIMCAAVKFSGGPELIPRVRHTDINYPLTYKFVNEVLIEIGQKQITRTFKRNYENGMGSDNAYYYKKGKVGNKNGTICLLTIAGFFEILLNRMRSVELKDKIFTLFKHMLWLIERKNKRERYTLQTSLYLSKYASQGNYSVDYELQVQHG